jgi:hypothetical protein
MLNPQGTRKVTAADIKKYLDPQFVQGWSDLLWDTCDNGQHKGTAVRSRVSFAIATMQSLFYSLASTRSHSTNAAEIVSESS